MKQRTVISVIGLAGLVAPAAMAATFSVAGTGTDASGQVLAGGSADPHYSVSGPGVVGVAPAVVYSPAAIWGGWVPNSSSSAWIGFSDSFDTQPHGNYSYSIRIDLSGYDASTASLSGRWAADQDGSILLNGASTGVSLPDGNWDAASHPNLNTFAISSGFKPGINTLSFVVNEPDGGDGLRVDPITVTANVPEPESWALMIAGLTTVAWLSRRRYR